MGREIRRLRHESGRTVQDLAYAARVNPMTWYRAERGLDMRLSCLRRIVAALGAELVLRI